MRILLTVILGIFGGWPTRQERVLINFITIPFEATIQLDGSQLLKADGTPYTTPCTIPDLTAGVHHVVLKSRDVA